MTGPVRRLTDRGTERVDADDLADGDRILVRHGEPVRVSGTVVGIQRPERNEYGVVRGDGTVAEMRVGGRGAPVGAVESPDSARRTVDLDERVRPEDTVIGATLVVKTDRRGVLPWLVGTLAGGTGGRAALKAFVATAPGRVLLVTLAVAIAFAGSGLGLGGPAGEAISGAGQAVADALGFGDRDTDDAPPAPAVDVEPPEADDPNRTTTTPPPTEEDGGDDGDEEDPTETTTDTTTGTTTDTTTGTTTDKTGTTTANTTSTTTATAASSAPLIFSGSSSPAPLDPNLTLDNSDPPTIRTPDGTLETVNGTVSGKLDWTGRADAVVFVVQTWVPGEGWAEVRRATVRNLSKPIDLADVLNETAYAAGSRARPFENPEPGTNLTTSGRLNVTAVFFRDGAETARASEERELNVTVRNDGTEPGPLQLQLGEGSGGENGTVQIIDFGSGGGSTGSDSGLVVPGAAGTNLVPLSNDGSRRGVLRLEDINYTSNENGLTGPESKVDDTPNEGELDGAVEIRARAEFANGTTRYVIGNATGYRTLKSLGGSNADIGPLDPGESLDLMVDFRVRESAGNEIQSDTVVVDFTFSLTELTRGEGGG